MNDSRSGLKLIIGAAISFGAPFILEVMSDGGPSHYGDPETGYMLVISASVLWPLALTLLIIGFKRLIASSSSASQAPDDPTPPQGADQTSSAKAWNMGDHDASKR